jgi:hypothetical protein
VTSASPTRVIQWATGPVGSVQLAEVIDNPEFELVGLFVYSPDKLGVDAGALVGRPETGVVATNDKAAILAAYRGGVEVLVAEEYWTGTGDTSEWGPSMASMIHDVLIGKA